MNERESELQAVRQTVNDVAALLACAANKSEICVLCGAAIRSTDGDGTVYVYRGEPTKLFKLGDVVHTACLHKTMGV